MWGSSVTGSSMTAGRWLTCVSSRARGGVMNLSNPKLNLDCKGCYNGEADQWFVFLSSFISLIKDAT